ncbi:MAG: DUF4405 domain-containing protein [Bacillota bacterium]|nr:DUF4405 domain-containing protein [Bacillota bacterium]
MNSKTIYKIIIDIVMTLLLLFLMAFHITGDSLHEWLGVGMFILFIVHHILNKTWYQNIFRGKYTAFRVLQAIVNTLIFVSMIGLMVSGIMLSRYVFTFLPIYGGMSFARKLHLLSSYWGFILMALHLGLHWGMLMKMAGKATKITSLSHKYKAALPRLGILIAAYGLYAFINRGLGSYMFLKKQYVFWNFDEPAAIFFLDYLAIMGLCIFTSHYTVKYIQKRFTKQNED